MAKAPLVIKLKEQVRNPRGAMIAANRQHQHQQKILRGHLKAAEGTLQQLGACSLTDASMEENSSIQEDPPTEENPLHPHFAQLTPEQQELLLELEILGKELCQRRKAAYPRKSSSFFRPQQ